MSGYQSDKIRAVILSALMVLSIFGGTVAFTGSAAAQQNVPTSEETATITDGAVVFQGQDNIEFNTGTTSLTGVSGDAEGQVVSIPIPEDQTVGTYSETGSADSVDPDFSVVIDQPRVSDFEIRNQNDQDITGGSAAKVNAENLSISVEYNYAEYENIDITVEDEDGLEITNAVITGSINRSVSSGDPALDQNGSVNGFTGEEGTSLATFGLDLSNEDAGTYTVTAEGNDELDFGAASSSGTVDLTAEDNVGVEFDSDSVTKGENNRFDVVGGIAGDLHLVTIDASEFDDDVTALQALTTFRDVQDTVERGVTTETGDTTFFHESDETNGNTTADVTGAYALMEIDDDTGLGVGSIDTTALDDSDVEVEVSDAVDPTSPIAVNSSDNTGDSETAVIGGDGDLATDDSDFTVNEGEVSLESPGRTYAVGSEVDVNGTAAQGIDDVAIYVRDEGEFELVKIDGEATIAVDADGTFEEPDVRLNDGSFTEDGYNTDPGFGNNILSLPGSYRIGVIAADDADIQSGSTSDGGSLDIGENNVDPIIDTSDFNSATSTQTSIRVLDQGLNAEFPSLIQGQISEDDNDVDVSGSAPGAERVLFIAVGPRGGTSTQPITVDSDQTFDEEDVSIGDLNKGAVSVHVLSIGRDGDIGDGNDLGVNNRVPTLSGFETFVDEDLETQSLTADQVRSTILAESVEETASDDLIVNQNARLVDTQSSIVDVYQDGNQASGLNPVAAGETMIVEVQTNLQPDDNTLTIELQNEDVSVGLASTDEWGSDGLATLEIDTADAATGTYTLEVDDSQNTVTEEIELVEQLSTATPTPTEVEDTPTATASPTPTATASPTATAAPDTDTPTPTEGGGPGFGAVVALVALLAAALLATRRDN